MIHRIPWLTLLLVLAVVFLFYPVWNENLSTKLGQPVGGTMQTVFVYGILALGLNIVIGNAGMLHLGIAAFFGLGAYITGILCVADYPFQFKFYLAVLCSVIGSMLIAVLISLPVIGLRGDYFALVTLGFGEVLRFTLRNLENITNGTKGIGPIPPPQPGDPLNQLMAFLFPTDFKGNSLRNAEGVYSIDWQADFRPWYLITLLTLIAVVIVLRNIERSRLGRAWVALREDELAAGAMGLNPTRLKLSAIAVGAGLAGLAGSLYCFCQGNTSDPEKYGFSTSIIVLCCLILGGLGNLRGVLLGVLLVIIYENLLSPYYDSRIQKWREGAVNADGKVIWQGINLGAEGSPYLSFTGWRLFVFGIILILVMRFRPSGILPARREA